MSSVHDMTTRVTVPDEVTARRREDDCLVVIHTPHEGDLGRRHLLRDDAVSLGRDRDNDIVLLSQSVSRHHARIEYRGGRAHVRDLASTNGTYVNDDRDPVTDTPLKRGDLIRVGDTIFKYLSGSDVEAQYHATIFNLAITDGLTQVGNKRALDDVLGREIPRARRYQRDLALLMIDVDHFKGVNDAHGHQAGDTVLRDLAATLRHRLRPDDMLGRYGGEEFAVVLPETSIRGAITTADDLRGLVASRTFTVEGRPIRITISVGAAVLESGMDADALIRAADRQLYAAKRAGRNRVVPRPAR